MEKIGSIVENILIELGFENLYYSGILKKNWSKVVGNLIAKVSSPDRVERDILYIKCSNPSWKQELYFFKDEIVKNVNKFFNKKIVNEIKIYFG